MSTKCRAKNPAVCYIHGTPVNASPGYVTVTDVAFGKEFNFANWMKLVDQAAQEDRKLFCENSYGDFATLEDARHTPSISVLWCDTHNTYHSYNSEKFYTEDTHMLHVVQELHQLFKFLRITAGITRSRTNQWQDICRQYDLPDQPGTHNFYVQLKQETARLRNIRQAHRRAQNVDLLYSVNNLTEDQLLNWYQCHRKVVFINKEAANQFLKENKAEGRKKFYQCHICNQIHIGGGTGTTPVDIQLKNAREKWNDPAYRLRVNKYVQRMGWVTTTVNPDKQTVAVAA